MFKGKDKKFISEKKFKSVLDSQVNMSGQTLSQLRNYDVDESKSLKLEVFFYTNTNEKAESLFQELTSLKYEAEYGSSADNPKILIITGWSIPIQMSEDIIKDWVSNMCHLGYTHDCEFDGWGTDPTQ